MSTALKAIQDGQALGRIVRSFEPSHSVEDLAKFAFAKPEPVVPVTLENAGGNIVGGILVIRGEREFELAKSFFGKTTKVEGGNAA